MAESLEDSTILRAGIRQVRRIRVWFPGRRISKGQFSGFN